MCVEKDERITDSRIKSGIQTILGGMVLAAIPIVLTGMFLAWDLVGDMAIEQRHFAKQIEHLERRIDDVERWRLETSKNRFRWSDGEAMRQVIAGIAQELRSLKETVIKHNTEAEKYIEKINTLERNGNRK